MATIGKQLSKVREEKALSIEDVAHSTRINANVIRKIELDDFSAFPSTGYAKSFLKQYGEFLDVDVSTAVVALDRGETEIIAKPSVDTMVIGVKQKIERTASFRPGIAKRVRRNRVEKPGGAPVFLGFILVVLIFAIGVFYFLGWQADSPEELKEEIKGRIAEVTSGSTGGKEEEEKKTSPAIPKIEKNPLRDAKNDSNTLSSPKPVPVPPIKSETPISKASTPPSRTGELPNVDFSEGPTTVGQARITLPASSNTSLREKPAVLRPTGTDPVAKRPEQAIIRAIPVAEPVVTNSTRN